MTPDSEGRERRSRRRPPPPVFRAGTALLAALGLSALLACGGDAPDRGGAPRDSVPRGRAASLPPARYLTLVAWTAAGGRPAGVLWMENRTAGREGLRRRYRGWTLEGKEGPRLLLSVDDRLAAAAAAWRVLPAEDLRLSVDTRGRISELRARRPGAGRLRLRIGPEMGSWRGVTGQRQRLAAGRLRREGDSAGIEITAAVLRFERLSGDPGRLGPAGLLLLAGGEGRGLLALAGATSRAWTRAWSWDAGGSVSRLSAGALPDSTPAGGPWRFALPTAGTGSRTEWRAAPEGVEARWGGTPGLRLSAATARVPGEGRARAARGLLLRSAGAMEAAGGVR